MTRRARIIWTTGAGIFTVINLGGGIYAAAMGEPLHAGAHVALTFVGAYAFWRLFANGLAENGLRWPGSEATTSSSASPDRIDSLQNSLDAVAVEVERIGEGQRFMARLVAEQDAAEIANQPAPAPLPDKPAAPPNVRRD